MLDVACGTRVAARLAAERVGPEGTVAGLDPNPAMLAVARESTPHGTSITWDEEPAEAISLPDESFDDVDLRSATKTLHLPSPEDFLWQYLHSTPLAATVAEGDEERRAALRRTRGMAWQIRARGRSSGS